MVERELQEALQAEAQDRANFALTCSSAQSEPPTLPEPPYASLDRGSPNLLVRFTRAWLESCRRVALRHSEYA
jgi:hypothetical protein